MSFQEHGPEGGNRDRRKEGGSKDDPARLPEILGGLRHASANARDLQNAEAGLHVDFAKKVKAAAVSPSAVQPRKEFHIRWMLERDLDRVAEIDRGSFDVPWQQEDWSRARKASCGVGMVTEIGAQVVGCCLYELHADHFKLCRLAVCPSFREQGLGFAVVKKLFDKLSFQRRTHVLATVRQDDLQVQKFFRACGFRAIPGTADTKGNASQEHYLFRADLREILQLEEQARAQHRTDSSGSAS